jgi:hypothetical protein
MILSVYTEEIIEKKSTNIIRISFFHICFFFFFFSDPWRYIYKINQFHRKKTKLFLHFIFFPSVYFRMIFQHHHQQKYFLLLRMKKKWITTRILQLLTTISQTILTMDIKMGILTKPKKYVRLNYIPILKFIIYFFLRLELKKVHHPVLVSQQHNPRKMSDILLFY